jgi:Zn-finger nucleic acid-binding protein
MAKWKPFDLTWGRSIYYCTECKEGIEVLTSCGKPMYKFCPMCGARMDTADTPQTEMDKCYKCKWWNYSYGCSNKKGICDFESIADTPRTDIVFYDYDPNTDDVHHIRWHEPQTERSK